MLVLIGASASGKTEIAKILIRSYDFKKIVTNTTREKRINEIDGIDYHFLSVDDFSVKAENNYFIETEVYDGNYYGTAFKDASLHSVLIVDTNGANSIYNQNIQHSVFIYLETSEDIRIQRMTSRGDAMKDIKNRIKKDRAHFSFGKINHVDFKLDTSKKSLETLALEVSELYKNKLMEDLS